MSPEGKRSGEMRRKMTGIGDDSAKRKVTGIGDNSSDRGYLDGQLLIAMPVMGDPRFERSVIYLCAHSSEGAMGIIVNRPAGSIDFPGLLVQLDIIQKASGLDRPVERGDWRTEELPFQRLVERFGYRLSPAGQGRTGQAAGELDLQPEAGLPGHRGPRTRRGGRRRG